MPPRPNPRAFTRIELLVVCAALGLMTLVVWPALASNKTDSERFLCFNNLRMIGRAVQMWAGDHNQEPPWRVPAEEGGLLPASGQRPGNAWFEFAYLSNQLVTPGILACPSDADRKRATSFTLSRNGGFMEPTFRFASLSYVIGLDAVGEASRSWLSGDRNLGGVTNAVGCSTRVNNIHAVALAPVATVLRWTNGVAHNENGHLLLMDGSVEFTSSARLNQLLLPPQAEDNGWFHFLRAQ